MINVTYFPRLILFNQEHELDAYIMAVLGVWHNQVIALHTWKFPIFLEKFRKPCTQQEVAYFPYVKYEYCYLEFRSLHSGLYSANKRHLESSACNLTQFLKQQ